MPEPAVRMDVLWQRTVLLAIGLLQGTALYFLTLKSASPLHVPAVSPFWAFIWTAPTIGMLILRRVGWLKDSVFAISIGLVAALIFKVTTGLFGIESDAASLLGDDGGSSILTTALWATCFLLFVIPAPFYQAAREARRFSFPYDRLFLNAWTNALAVLVSIGFLIINWIVLALWAALFKTIKIDVFADLFTEPWFYLPFSGGMLGLGSALSREREPIIHALLKLVTTLFRFLAPTLACAVLLFLLALPFTGLEALWGTRIASRLILSAVFLFILFENAVIQTDEERNSFWKPAEFVVIAANIAMPVLVALAGWAIFQRVDQYGWTPLRLYTAMAAGIAFLYAVAYCLSCLTAWRSWTNRVIRLNPLLALVTLAVAILMHFPPLDPYSLSARDQLARLRDGRIAPERFDFAFLRLELGKAGRDAFQEIEHDDALMKERHTVDSMDLAKRLQRYSQNWRRYPSLADSMAPALLDVTRYIEIMPQHPVPPKAALEKWIKDAKFILEDCRSRYLTKQPRCWIVDVDLNGDGILDFALFTGHHWGYHWRTVLQQRDGSWCVGRSLHAGSTPDLVPMQDALKRGDIRIVPHESEMKDLIVGGVRFK
jgi:hypothetical protein